jgi:ABC-2 type transport system ATP-binding protein
MIQAKGLTKKFDEFYAVRNVDLEVAEGRVLVLLGPNGAGKTTTIRMLSSVLRPTSGSAIVAGYDVVENPREVRRSVGVLTEQHGLYNRMNAKDYLRFFAEAYQMDSEIAAERIKSLLDQFGLGDTGKKRLGEFSKGMRQKLALVRAMLHNPPILLMDEPTSAMDPESARMVRDSIRKLRSSERTLLLCTHNLPEAEELADRIAIIQDGQILIDDTPQRLKEKLLGPDEFEIQFSNNINGRELSLPDGITRTYLAESCIRFRTAQPEMDNPKLLRYLLDSGMDVVSLKKMPQSLENAYLQAIHNGKETTHVQ